MVLNAGMSSQAGSTSSPSMPSDSLSPAVAAAVLLYCNRLYREYKLPSPCSAEQLIKAVGASRSQAYNLSHAVDEVLRGLVRPVGQ